MVGQKIAKKHKKFTKRDFQLFSLIGMSVLFLIVFNYFPMFGLIFAFKDGDGSLNVLKGMFGAEWTLDNFSVSWHTVVESIRSLYRLARAE